jgi:hypothetical protein
MNKATERASFNITISAIPGRLKLDISILANALAL